jgi:hypothetical protein
VALCFSSNGDAFVFLFVILGAAEDLLFAPRWPSLLFRDGHHVQGDAKLVPSQSLPEKSGSFVV